MPDKFDTQVHYRNKKTGMIEKANHYKYTISKDGSQLFERGGKFYHPDGSLLGGISKPVVQAKPVIKAHPVEVPKEKKKPGRPKKVEEPAIEEVAKGA